MWASAMTPPNSRLPRYKNGGTDWGGGAISRGACSGCSLPPTVVYLERADNESRPVPSPLRVVNQPVSGVSMGVPWSDMACFAYAQAHRVRVVSRSSPDTLLIPTGAGATAAPDTTAPPSASTRGPSGQLPSPAYRI